MHALGLVAFLGVVEAENFMLILRVRRILRPFRRESISVVDSLRAMGSGAVNHSLACVASRGAFLIVGLVAGGASYLGGHVPVVEVDAVRFWAGSVACASAAAEAYLGVAVRRVRRQEGCPPPPGRWAPSPVTLRLLVILAWAFWPAFILVWVD